MRRSFFILWIFFILRVSVPAEEWYTANAGGMALERAYSRTVALRLPYSLLVEEKSAAELPPLLVPYYRAPWSVERRVLYHDGEESRSQWIFRDNRAVSRIVAVFTIPQAEEAAEEEVDDDADVEEDVKEAAPVGFIEVYGENSLIAEDWRLSEGGEELAVYYHYNPVPRRDAADPAGLELLVSADTRRKFFDGEGNEVWEDVCTDYYRYTRNLSLRAIERVYRTETSQAASQAASQARLRFPRRSLDSTLEEQFVSPVLAYGTQFLEDVQADSSFRVVYTTGERGRILGETRYDQEGNVIGELRNEWSGDRISRIVWKAGGDERIIEYTYNADGDRIQEQNYNNGTLERVVHIDGDREDEELYMNGELILRAHWEGGRKIREERVRGR